MSKNPWLIAPTLLLMLLAACRPPQDDAAQDTRALADTLSRLITDAYDFSRPGVVERMSALYPDGRVISASNGNITTSSDSLRHGIQNFWTNVGRNMREPRWLWGKIYVDRLSVDAAVLTANWTIPHLAPNDQLHVIGGAWTAVFRRINGEWKIVHEHLSE